MPTRRSFLKVSALGAAAALARRAPAFARSASPHDGRCLVLLQLSGGNDGLNTVVPFGDERYAGARGALALGKQDVVKIADGVGLHRELGGFAELWDAGRLAIVEGVGYPDPVRSHFLSMDVWHGADASGRNVGSGWIARLADAAFADVDEPNLIVALGPRVPFSCDGGEHRAVTLETPRTYRIHGASDAIESLDAAVEAQQVSERARAFLKKAYLDARASSEALQAAYERYRPAVEYGTTPLARDLRTVASLLAGGVPTRVFAVETDGFDTHARQAPRHETLLRNLGDGVAAFLADLEAQGLSERVLVVAFSEFGRRVAANGSGGTDHGAAGPVFALGAPVRGGFFGARPDLGDLDANGDLRFTTDFRRVYSTVIERWLGGDAATSATVLGDAYAPLEFLEA